MEMAESDALPLPGELDSPEESPYLRRQKSVPVRRSRISRRVRIALFVVAVLLPVGFAGYGIATFALTSSFFVLSSPDNIVVTGSNFVSRDEVLGALGLPLTGHVNAGTNVFHMSLDGERRSVETLPWVRTAAVTVFCPTACWCTSRNESLWRTRASEGESVLWMLTACCWTSLKTASLIFPWCTGWKTFLDLRIAGRVWLSTWNSCANWGWKLPARVG